MHRLSFLLVQIFGIVSILNVLYPYHLINALTTSQLKQTSQQLTSPFLQSSKNYLAPFNSIRWLNFRPFGRNANYDSYNLEKRDVLYDENKQRNIRSPLGTMRFGKRSINNSPFSTMRFGKREDYSSDPIYSTNYIYYKRDINNSPLGTMRFGKRDIENPLGTMRFGKRDIENPLGTMRFGKRDIDNPLGTMRFGKRDIENPLGTMRFGKRDIDNPLGTMRFGKRGSDNSPLGTMRFGKRSDNSMEFN